MIRALYLLFVLSGAAGLIYESIWTRYLGLFVGHDAYAQIIVLVIFLGGMSVGAPGRSAGDRRAWPSRSMDMSPSNSRWASSACSSTTIFQAATSWAYASVYPELAGTWLLPVAKWGIASALILPQSVLLGATFPLMSAGVLRLVVVQPGPLARRCSTSPTASAPRPACSSRVSTWCRSPGSRHAAHRGDAQPRRRRLRQSVVIVVATKRGEIDADGRGSGRRRREPAEPSSDRRPATPGLERLLLWTSLGTAVASFIYEIDWIRMLALVLGSATHSFELMLSAFILGLAFGAWWIRSRADRLDDPLRTLGIVQWTMGSWPSRRCRCTSSRSTGWRRLLSTFARTTPDTPASPSPATGSACSSCCPPHSAQA